MTNTILKYAYLGCLVGVVLTLQIVIPPFRIYTVDGFLFCTVAALGLVAIEGRFSFRLRWETIDYLVVALLIIATVSTFFSEYVFRAIAPLTDWMRFTLFWFISRIVALRYIRPESVVKASCWIVIALIFAGLIEKATGTAYALIGNYFGGSLEQDTSKAYLDTGQTMKRISGTTSNPNVFGQWVVFYGTFAILYLIHRRLYLYCVLTAVGCGLIMIFTAARGNLLALLVTGVAIVWLNRSQFANLLVRIVLAVGLLLILGIFLSDKISVGEGVDVVLQRFNREFGRTTLQRSERVIVAKMSLELLQRDPKNLFFGVGGESFFPAYLERPARYSREDSRSGAHNVWLKSAVEYGLILMVCLLAFFLQALRIGFRLVKQENLRQNQLWGQFLLSYLLSYLLVTSQLYESALTYHSMIPLFCIIGFATTMEQNQRLTFTQARLPERNQPAARHLVRG